MKNKRFFIIITLLIMWSASICISFICINNADGAWSLKAVIDTVVETVKTFSKEPEPDVSPGGGSSQEDVDKVKRELHVGTDFLVRITGLSRGTFDSVDDYAAEILVANRDKAETEADSVEASVNQTKEINKLTREYNDHIYREIKDLKEDSDRLNKQIAQGKKAEEGSRKLKEKAIKKRDEANKYLAEARLVVDEKKKKFEDAKKVSGTDVAELELEIRELETHLGKLERSVEELASIDQKHGTL